MCIRRTSPNTPVERTATGCHSRCSAHLASLAPSRLSAASAPALRRRSPLIVRRFYTPSVKHVVLVLFSVAVCLTACAAEPENELQTFVDELRRNTSQDSPPIALTARLSTRAGEHFLSFRMTNVSQQPLSFYPYMLPWGHSNSLMFAAVATDATPVRSFSLLNNPPTQRKLTIAPGETREGEYPLSWGLAYEEAPKDRDILLMWTYRVIVGDGPFPVCSGVIVIPKRQ
jgi:hypothetical protein